MHPTPAPRSAALATLFLATLLAAPPARGQTERVNVTSAGAQTGGFANWADVSADGRYVVFHSGADDVVPGDTNFSRDVFVHDRVTGVTSRVSVSSGGSQGNGHSEDASITDDGRYVLFTSSASNLVSGDTNGAADVFLHDRTTGTTVRVSVGPGGVQGDWASREAEITPDGNYVVFASGASNLLGGPPVFRTCVYHRELATGTNTLVSATPTGGVPDDWSGMPVVSDDGQLVAFHSRASDLVPGDTNTFLDVFVRDLGSGQTTRVSESTTGVQANSYSQEAAISGDGRFVAFESRATNLVVPPDNNSYEDAYLHDRLTAETTLVSRDALGDLGNFPSANVALSGDGRYVAFQSWASDLIPGDTNGMHDIYVLDTFTGLPHRVDLDMAGGESDNHSYSPAISPDGRFLVYESFATDLVPGDTNQASDIFITDFLGSTGCPPPGIYCTSKATSLAGCLPSIGFAGAPSLAAGSGFDVTAGPTPGGSNPGLFVYTTSGNPAPPIATAYGDLCLLPGTMFRIGLQSGGGSAGACDGQYTIDFNLYAATQNENPALVAGAVVDLQAWYRDPPAPGSANLTNAGRFQMCP